MSLVKKINIDPAALAVIGRMTWDEDGGRLVGKITDGKLDRKLYDAVNKGLDALGGKWNRALVGHVFADDPRPGIGLMLGTGFVEVEKDGFFPTPPDVVFDMLTMLKRSVACPWLEPEAGAGDICKMVHTANVCIHVCEKNDKRRTALAKAGYTVVGDNFLEYAPEEKYMTILMNPPFEDYQDIDHIMHAFNNCLADGGEMVAVCSGSRWFDPDGNSQALTRKAAEFRHLVEQFGRMKKLAENSFKVSGTGVNTCLVYLEKPAVEIVKHRHTIRPIVTFEQHVQLGFEL